MKLQRRKPPAIEFIARFPKAVEMFPPMPAGKAVPDWYRAQPPFLKERRFPNLRLRTDVTIKGCPGVGDYLGMGYILPMWADYIVGAIPEGFRWDAAVKPELNVFHPETWDHFPRPAGTHDWMIKISTPWHIRTPKGWSVMVLQPWYHPNSKWSVFPGVMDSDRCPVLNLIAMWHAPLEEAVLMKAGTPLLHIIPFRRDKLALDVKSDPEEFEAMTGRSIGAVEGRRLAAGAYREDRLREEVTTTN